MSQVENAQPNAQKSPVSEKVFNLLKTDSTYISTYSNLEDISISANSKFISITPPPLRSSSSVSNTPVKTSVRYAASAHTALSPLRLSTQSKIQKHESPLNHKENRLHKQRASSKQIRNLVVSMNAEEQIPIPKLQQQFHQHTPTQKSLARSHEQRILSVPAKKTINLLSTPIGKRRTNPEENYKIHSDGDTQNFVETAFLPKLNQEKENHYQSCRVDLPPTFKNSDDLSHVIPEEQSKVLKNEVEMDRGERDDISVQEDASLQLPVSSSSIPVIEDEIDHANNLTIKFPDLAILDHLSTLLLSKCLDGELQTAIDMHRECLPLQSLPAFKLAVFKSNFTENAPSYRKIKLIRLLQLVYLIQESENSKHGSSQDEALIFKYWEEMYCLFTASIVPPEWIESEEFMDLVLRLRTIHILMKACSMKQISDIAHTLKNLASLYERLNIEDESIREAYSNHAFKIKLLLKPFIDDWEIGEKIWNKVEKTLETSLLHDIKSFIFQSLNRFGLNGPSLLDSAIRDPSTQLDVLEKDESLGLQNSTHLEKEGLDQDDDENATMGSPDLSVDRISVSSLNNAEPNTTRLVALMQQRTFDSSEGSVSHRSTSNMIPGLPINGTDGVVTNDCVDATDITLALAHRHENEETLDKNSINPSQEDLGGRKDEPDILMKETEEEECEEKELEKMLIEDVASHKKKEKHVQADENLFLSNLVDEFHFDHSYEEESSILGLDVKLAPFILGQLVAEVDEQYQLEEDSQDESSQIFQSQSSDDDDFNASKRSRESQEEDVTIQRMDKKRNRRDILLAMNTQVVIPVLSRAKPTSSYRQDNNRPESMVHQQHDPMLTATASFNECGNLNPNEAMISSTEFFDSSAAVHYSRSFPTRVPWTEEELHVLEEGMMKLGTNWAGILGLYGEQGTLGTQLASRNALQLKDKARNEKCRRLREGLALGVFAISTNYKNREYLRKSQQ